MITKEQFVNGIISYADHEVIPNLPTIGKWGIGTIICLAKNKIDEIVNTLVTNPLVKALDIVSPEGLIDADTLLNALKQSATKYGRLEINVPFLGTLAFSENDVSKLKNYMCPAIEQYDR